MSSTDSIPMIIPTCDIHNGVPVIVQQGVPMKPRGMSFDEYMEKLSIFPRITIIDLDKAFGTGDNSHLYMPMLKKKGVYIGGGIHTFDECTTLLNASACRVIISKSMPQMEIDKIVALNKRNRFIGTFDVNSDLTECYYGGRKHVEPFDIDASFETFSKFCDKILITVHTNEGMMRSLEGTYLDKLVEYAHKHNVRIILAGGLSTVEDIQACVARGITPQLGAAIDKIGELFPHLYSGLIVSESGGWNGLRNTPHFMGTTGDNHQKQIIRDPAADTNVLCIPTIVTNESMKFLMFGHSTTTSIEKCISTGYLHLWSMSRSCLWKKGETSGNTQKVTNISFTCLGDSLVISVKEDHPICHRGKDFCYTTPTNFHPDILKYMIDNISTGPADSYSKKVLATQIVPMKLLEEVNEIVATTNKEDRTFELADLLYWMSMYMMKYDITPSEIFDELRQRRFQVSKKRYPKSNKLQDTVGIVKTKYNKSDEFIKALDTMKAAHEHYRLCCLSTIPPPLPTYIYIHPRDVPLLLANGTISAALTYSDVLENSPLEYKVSTDVMAPTHSSYIALFCNADANKEELRAKQYYTVGSEFFILSNKHMTEIETFIKKHLSIESSTPIKVKLNEIHGNAESYVKLGIYDFGICVTQSGTSFRENNMTDVGHLFDVHLGMYAIAHTDIKLCTHQSSAETK